MSHIEFFLKKPIFTFVILGVLMAVGMGALRSMNVETLPEVNTSVIYAAVPLPGGAPEEVEALVTIPLEEKIAEIEGTYRIMSTCWQNVAVVVAFFDEDVIPEEKFKEFRDKVAEVRAFLPEEAMEPIIEEISFENLPMMFVGFPGGGKSQFEISRYATQIRKELEAVPGVKKVSMTGATERRIEIRLWPEGLKKYGSDPLKLLIEDMSQINTNMPGGKIMMGDNEMLVRTIGKFDSLDDLREMVVAVEDGEPVPLSDMADVEETYPDPETIVRINGERGVALGIMKKRGYGTIDVAEKVKGIISSYGDVVVMADASEFIDHQMSDLRNHALWGVCLVMIVLFISLGFRVAAIVTISLPIAFFLTFIAMYYNGMTINMVTLFSLLLALGMMVDNSIVVCENIFRHRMMNKSAFDASLEGTAEVSWPIFSSTAAIVSAFLPMAIFLGGPIGEFTAPISIVVTFSLIASLIVANFLNPIMCETFIKNIKVHEDGEQNISAARRIYARVAEWSMDHSAIVISAAVLLLVGCVLLVVLKVVGMQLFPQLDTAKFYIDMKTPTGSTVEDTGVAVDKIEKYFEESGYVANSIVNIGSSGTRLEIDDHVFRGSNIARFIVDLKPASQIATGHKQAIQKMRDEIPALFDDDTEINFIEKVLGPPVGPPINIMVTGQEFEQLEKMTAAIREMLEKEPGVIDLKDNMPELTPEILLRAKQGNMAKAGLTTRDLGGFIFLTLTGYRIGDLIIDNERQDLFLKIKQDEGEGIMSAGKATFQLPNGESVKLFDLVSPAFTNGRASVERENQKRTVTIEAGVSKGYEAKRIVDGLMERVDEKEKELVAEDPAMKDIEVVYGGENLLLAQALRDLVTAVLVSLVLIYLILIVEFKSTTQPLIILLCVPYALVGVILGLLVMGYSFSILSGIGLLCLIGIVVNNGIIYIDYANLLQARGMALKEACLEACMTRLRPIVLTKATVILGIMPLALASAGKTQFWKPLCWAIIWGLLIATTLTLIIIPVAYYVMEKWRTSYYKKHKTFVMTPKDKK